MKNLSHFPRPFPGTSPAHAYLARSAAICMPLVLAGCAAVAPSLSSSIAKETIATQWHAPLPHDGRVEDLRHWWSRFDDPLMLSLIEAAQRASPTLAQATANIADARAARTASGAALLPSLNLTADASRGRSDLAAPAATASSVGLQVSWELDLFGANRAGSDAALARLEASQAGWHGARVSIAAEVAKNYVELRACEATVLQAEIDAASRTQTARLTDVAVRAGIRANATVHLARASAAQGTGAVVNQKAQCDLLVKALVALAAQDEPTMRLGLAQRAARFPWPVGLAVVTVPADVLAQRPDIYSAARDVAAASAASAQATAQRWPRISLAGNIGSTRSAGGGISSDGAVWSVGPVTITFPLFDGGVRRANAQAAQVRYETATTVYAARVREAIREVESALVTLHSTAQRNESAEVASDGFERSYRAALAGYQAGSTSLFELEDARRSMVTAQTTVIDVRRERLLAFIALYRAMGGGWSRETPPMTGAAPTTTAPNATTYASAISAPTERRN